MVQLRSRVDSLESLVLSQRLSIDKLHISEKKELKTVNGESLENTMKLEKEIEKFRSLTVDFELKDEYETYVEKHIVISKKYAEIFDYEISEINLLHQFFEDTKYITDDNYNPADVKEIMNSICLM